MAKSSDLKPPLVISKILQILGIQPRISKLFLNQQIQFFSQQVRTIVVTKYQICSKSLNCKLRSAEVTYQIFGLRKKNRSSKTTILCKNATTVVLLKYSSNAKNAKIYKPSLERTYIELHHDSVIYIRTISSWLLFCSGTFVSFLAGLGQSYTYQVL